MTFEQFQQQIYSLEESGSKPLQVYMAKLYKEAEKEIISEMETLYLNYLQTADPGDYYNILIQYDRLEKSLISVQKIYNDYAKKSGTAITQMASMSMSNTYYRKLFTLNWVAPEGLSLFHELDPRIIELSVTGTVDQWNKISALVANKYLPISDVIPQYGTLTDLLYKAKTQDLLSIQQIITQGFIQGKTYNQLSKQISEAVNTSIWKALRIARTESTRTMNLAAQLATIDAANMGLEIQREYVASLDDRTRPKHGRMDGVRAAPDKPFKKDGITVMRPGAWGNPADDINERCTTIDIVTVNGEEISPQIRKGKNPYTGVYETFDYKNFDDWAKSNNLKQNKYGGLYAA